MIKPEELRIGNWVIWEHAWYQVDGIEPEPPLEDQNEGFWHRKIYLKNDHLGDEIVRSSELSAIDLTPEILEKAGFEPFKGWLNRDAWSPGHPSQRFDLYWSESDGFMTKSRYQKDNPGYKMRHIKHLHQLQNLYYCLCGEEIDIQL